jgi:branched-chain amino acid transport system ATP-binding protein
VSILRAKNLTKSFGGLLAVQDLSFELKQGEILGLIGPNGAGKTTVFNCLTGFLPLDSGQVWLEGDSITGLKPFDLCRRGLVRTFQIVRPFLNVSVLDNVMIGSMLRHRSLGEAQATAAGIIEFVGLRNYLTVQASGLPLPLRKRLELAKALATDPKVLLLDEVMAGLNPTEVAEMIGLIKKTNERGMAVLLIEHVMQGVMALSDRVLVINYGRQIASGTPQEVVKDKDVIEAYLGEEFVHAQG